MKLLGKQVRSAFIQGRSTSCTATPAPRSVNHMNTAWSIESACPLHQCSQPQHLCCCTVPECCGPHPPPPLPPHLARRQQRGDVFEAFMIQCSALTASHRPRTLHADSSEEAFLMYCSALTASSSSRYSMAILMFLRSEERRVGNECRSGGSGDR